MSRIQQFTLRGQAVYYALTGLWPLIHIQSFEWVTGPKTDDWLVYMVGLLAATIGAALWIATRWRKQPAPPAIIALSIMSALAFAAIDIVFVLNDTISRIYLADAVVQTGIILWVLATMRRVARHH